MMITKLLAVASLASAVVVRDAAKLRAELARGAPSIELAADINLGGEELTVSAPCDDGERRPPLTRAATWRTSAPSVENS